MQNKIAITALAAAALGLLPIYAKPFYAIGSDGAFVVMAAQADMTIAHIGKEAEDRASDSKIKDFGKALSQDHITEYQQLTEAAAKAKDVIPKAIDRPNDRIIAALDHFHGKAYDHAFLTRQITEHETLVKAFKHEADHGSNAELKAFANRELPIIERHLHDAQDLLKQGA
jgi:putative membrane protein